MLALAAMRDKNTFAAAAGGTAAADGNVSQPIAMTARFLDNQMAFQRLEKIRWVPVLALSLLVFLCAGWLNLRSFLWTRLSDSIIRVSRPCCEQWQI
jgi:hypothetical protein